MSLHITRKDGGRRTTFTCNDCNASCIEDEFIFHYPRCPHHRQGMAEQPSTRRYKVIDQGFALAEIVHEIQQLKTDLKNLDAKFDGLFAPDGLLAKASETHFESLQ